MNGIVKLRKISDDIRQNTGILKLHKMVEELHLDKISHIINELWIMKSSIDIEFKFKDMPIDVQEDRKHLIRLLCDTQDLLTSVKNKDDALIKDYNYRIIEMLTKL